MNELKQWEEATTNLANYFIAKYFGKDTDNWWISQDIGGTLCKIGRASCRERV